MEDLLRLLIAEQIKTRQLQEKTNEMLSDILNEKVTGKDLDELLTAEQVSKEYGIGAVKVGKMFQDPELETQRYTKPFKVTRRALNKYFSKSHDYLCD